MSFLLAGLMILTMTAICRLVCRRVCSICPTGLQPADPAGACR
jgi:hypothetical protein